MNNTDSFNKVYLEENILYVDNFMSDEEIEKIYSMKLNWKKDRGEDVHDNILTAIIEEEEDQKIFRDLVENRVRLFTDNENQKLKKRNMLTKYVEMEERCDIRRCHCDGYQLSFHYENHPECDFESRWITLGVVVYFNDDYEGGELIFEHKPVKIKPKKGSLMVFPASEEYSHAVKQCFGNERLVFASFVYGKVYWDILHRSGLTEH